MAASSTSSSVTNEIDLEALIQSLPACKRCRDCRRGCDTLLPKCRQCSKAGVDCIFFDHGKNELLHRSYIAKLVDHVRDLSARNRSSPATPGGTVDGSSASGATLKAESVISDMNPTHYDHHFAFAGGSYRYLGAESCLLKSPRLQQSVVQSPVIPEDEDFQLVLSASTSRPYYYLVQTYLNVIQPLFPIMDTRFRFLAREVPADLTPTELFSLNMVYSIACYLEPGTNKKISQHSASGKLDFHHHASDKYRCLAAGFFDRAMEHLEPSTVESTIATLRAVLLLALNSLFDPKSGNIGQQVALATRLALNLEAKLDAQELSSEDAEMIHSMHSTIFSLENEIASALDRPATFPEPECDLSFDPTRPSDFLCSLYRLQHRFRKGDESVKFHLPRLDESGVLLPGLRLALHQTHLLLNPCWGSAWHVLEAVVSVGTIHVFLTPHWVYRAGCVLVQNMPSIYGANLIQLYSNALVVLELSSGKWPSTVVLRDSLVDLMKHMKTKYRPTWENNLNLYDDQPPDASATHNHRRRVPSTTNQPPDQR